MHHTHTTVCHGCGGTGAGNTRGVCPVCRGARVLTPAVLFSHP